MERRARMQIPAQGTLHAMAAADRACDYIRPAPQAVEALLRRTPRTFSSRGLPVSAATVAKPVLVPITEQSLPLDLPLDTLLLFGHPGPRMRAWPSYQDWLKNAKCPLKRPWKD